MITRFEAAAYLHSRLRNLAAAVGQSSAADDAEGYGPDIDAALRELGVGEDEVYDTAITSEFAQPFFALCEYYALSRLHSLLLDRVTFQTGTERFDFDKQRASVESRLNSAAARCKAFGLLMGASADDAIGGGYSLGVLDLGWGSSGGACW